MKEKTKVIELFQGKKDDKKDSKKGIIELLNGLIKEVNKGELENFSQICVIMMNDQKESEEDLLMVNTNISPMKMVGLLELVKLRYIETNV